jgi:hypothetical protein
MRLADVNVHFMSLANLEQVLDPRFRQGYTQRKFGGIFVFREYSQRYVDDKKARVIANNAEITKLIGRRGAQPLFASKLILDRDPKAVQRFVRGWARALQQIADPAHKAAVVRTLQIYYLRQHGGVLRQDLAELYVTAASYDRVAWTDEDIAEVTINGKALSAARNLLFANIKEPDKRPFGVVPDVKSFVDMSYAKQAMADLEAEKKAAPPKGEAPAKKEEKPAAPPKPN